MEQIQLDCLFCLIAHQKKMCNGLRRNNFSFKFIQKLWNLNSKILYEIEKNHKNDSDENLTKYTNKFLKE